MLNALNQILEFFKMIANFFNSMYTGLIQGVFVISNGISYIIRLVGFMPTVISSSMLIILIIGIVNWFLARG